MTGHRSVAIAFMTGSAFVWTAPVHAQAGKAVNFDLPAQRLADSLEAVSRQTATNIVFAPETVAGREARALKGQFGAQEAVTRLLADSKLRFTVNADNTILVRSKEAPGELQGNSAASMGGGFSSGGEVLTGSTAAENHESADIVVTGTNISGAAPVGAPLSVYDREDFRRRGVATVSQLMKQLPENAPVVDAATAGNGAFSGLANAAQSNNSGRGTQVDLHAVGSGATLVLLDGQRLAPSGADGSLVDVSLIPLPAIERVEILSDGSSAIYGADAVAGVVNFILRDDYAGLNTTARVGGTTRGGGRELQGSVTGGHTWSSGNIIASYEHYDMNAITLGQRPFVSRPFEDSADSTIEPSQRRNSVFGSLRQKISESLTASITGYASRRRSGSFTDSPDITTDSIAGVKIWGGNIALKYRLVNSWRIDLEGATSRSSLASETSLSFPGFSLQALNRSGSQTTGVDLRVNGPLFSMPGGLVRIALGAHARREAFKETLIVADSASQPYGDQLHRTVHSLYAELIAPVITDQNPAAWAKSLRFSGAARYDKYSDGGSAINPKVGVSWQMPFDVTLRSSFALSFRAPPLALKTDVPFYEGVALPDPDAPGGVTNTIVDLSNGNSSIRPEKARSITAGFDIRPRSLLGLQFSATWFRVSYNDRIASPPLASGNPFNVLNEKQLASPYLNLSPSSDQIAGYVASPGYVNMTGVDNPSYGAIFDYRLTNVARSVTEGLDAKVTWHLDLTKSEIDASLSATKLFSSTYRATSSLPAVEALDTVFNPADFKGYATVTWSNRQITATSSLNYVDSYVNTLTLPSSHVGSQITADINLAYRASRESPLGGSVISLTISNIFDKKPPIIDRPSSLQALISNYDPVNSSVRGRFIALQISRDW